MDTWTPPRLLIDPSISDTSALLAFFSFDEMIHKSRERKRDTNNSIRYDQIIKPKIFIRWKLLPQYFHPYWRHRRLCRERAQIYEDVLNVQWDFNALPEEVHVGSMTDVKAWSRKDYVVQHNNIMSRERARERRRELTADPHSSRWGCFAFLRRSSKGSCAKRRDFKLQLRCCVRGLLVIADGTSKDPRDRFGARATYVDRKLRSIIRFALECATTALPRWSSGIMCA